MMGYKQHGRVMLRIAYFLKYLNEKTGSMKLCNFYKGKDKVTFSYFISIT